MDDGLFSPIGLRSNYSGATILESDGNFAVVVRMIVSACGLVSPIGLRCNYSGATTRRLLLEVN